MAIHSLGGTMIKLNDYTTVETKVVPKNWQDTEACLNLLLRDMTQRRNTIVGFAVDLDVEGDRPKIAMLKFCTELGCLLVRLNPRYGYPEGVLRYLRVFMALKEPIFAGVHLKEKLKILRSEVGVVVENAVELSELAAAVMGEPALVAYGARDLAARVVNMKFVTGISSVEHISFEELERATIDVYAAYKVAEKILGSH